jgi:tetratricopeptide (TPR) repeat protein
MWFLGAGASASAGVRTASQMTWDFKRRIYASAFGLSPQDVGQENDPKIQALLQVHFDRLGQFPGLGHEDEYAAYFAAAYPQEQDRRQYIDNCVRKSVPSIGHMALARQLIAGRTPIVWTTNFDALIEDAMVRVVGTTTRLAISTNQSSDIAIDALNEHRWPLLVKLHGDFQSRRLKNVSAELATQEAQLASALVEASRRFGLALIGYSGRDSSVMSALEEAIDAGAGFPSGLFWLIQPHSEPLPRVRQLIERALAHDIQATCVTIDGFDQVLTALEQQFDPVPSPSAWQRPSDSGPADPGLAGPSDAGNLFSQVAALTTEISGAASVDLDRFQTAWREGRRSEVRTWLKSVTTSRQRLRAMHPTVASRILRFAAAVAFEDGDDVADVETFLAEARTLDPTGDDIRIRAVLLSRKGNRDAALALLETSLTPGATNLRAALLLEAGRLSDAQTLLSSSEVVEGREQAEHFRLQALLRLGSGDSPGALAAAQAAIQLEPNSLIIQVVLAVITFYEGVLPLGHPESLPGWPRPIDPLLIRRDPPAIDSFERAAALFKSLLRLDLSHSERRRMEAWYLAAQTHVPRLRNAAIAYATEVLARDPTHPHVVLWSAHNAFALNLEPSFTTIEGQLDSAPDDELVLLLASAYLAVDHYQQAASVLDRFQYYFTNPDARPQWAFWRANAAIALEEYALAEELLPEIANRHAMGLKAVLLSREATNSLDLVPLIEHLEASATSTGQPRYLIDACEWQAKAGNWQYVNGHIATLLEEFATPEVRRLAVFAAHNTKSFAKCASLLDHALSHPEEGYDLQEARRMRARARESLGQLHGAIDDLKALVAIGTQPPRIEDVLSLARLQFLAGLTHDLASTATALRKRPDLAATDALMLAETLTHTDAPLAQQLWEHADGRGIPDEAVPMAVALGYQLGLDTVLQTLTRRMAALAASGHPHVKQFTLDEVVAFQHEWSDQRDAILARYKAGEVFTHLVAQVLNVPLVQFYHFGLAANEARSSLRRQVALQARNGRRGVPPVDTALVGPMRLAMDVSGLLLAAHLDLLTILEAQYRPIRLPRLIIPALLEQREQLAPHQPSRIEVSRRLLQAERNGWIRSWDGELPETEVPSHVSTGKWARWLSLLERAHREGAFVVDLPMLGDHRQDQRPVEFLDPDRLARLVTPTTIQTLLDPPGRQTGVAPADPRVSDSPRSGTPSTQQVAPGSVLYLTGEAPEALSASGALSTLAGLCTILVDPLDQHTRRAQLDALSDSQEQASWVESLSRRISDGLADGRYELLPLSIETLVDTESRDSEPVGGATEQRDEMQDQEQYKSSHRAGANTSSAGRGRGTKRQSPLTMRLLEELLTLAPGTVDAICIDDRCLNRHQYAGTARITDTLELMAALLAAGSLSSREHWARVLRLRASNVRLIPLTPDEILHHLNDAPIVDRQVVDTRALRILRQSAAAMVDGAGLHIPSPDELASGDFGELLVARDYIRALHDSLFSLWSPSESGEALNVDSIRARSRWVLDNLYFDMGLLRARLVHPGTPPAYSVSATGVISLLAGTIRLLSPTNDNSTKPPDDSARAFAEWVYDDVISPRVRLDPSFRKAISEHLRVFLADWPERTSEESAVRMAARVFAGRLYDALPAPLRDDLASDRALMAFIGRDIVSSLSVGGRPISVADFARAGARATSGQADSVPLLDAEPPEYATVSFSSKDRFEVRFPDGTQYFLPQDLAFGALLADPSDRMIALEGFRAAADLDGSAWEHQIENLVLVSDPGQRLSALLEFRQNSVQEHYRQLVERWQKETHLRTEDLNPCKPADYLKHLRLPRQPITPEDWERAFITSATTLAKEDGLVEAFTRLSGLPLPFDAIHLSKIVGQGEIRKAVKHLLGGPTSPVGLIQAIKLLSELGNEAPAFSRLARRLARQVATPQWEVEVELLRLVAMAAYEYLDARDGRSTQCGPHLASSWYHAHRFICGMKAAGGDIKRVSAILERRSSPVAGNMFDNPSSHAVEIANPRNISANRLALAGLRYVNGKQSPVDSAVVGRFVRLDEADSTPSRDLLRDTGALTNLMSSWLPIPEEPDGSLAIQGSIVVPSTFSPTGLKEQSLVALETNPYDSLPWAILEVTVGPIPLTDANAARFVAATENLDLADLLKRLGPHARVAATRLARQSIASDALLHLRVKLREAVCASHREYAETRNANATLGEGANERDASGQQELNEPQLVALETLYLLSLGEPSRLESMSCFARDLSTLGLQDNSFLQRMRWVLERWVKELPLEEAHYFTALVAEARGC